MNINIPTIQLTLVDRKTGRIVWHLEIPVLIVVGALWIVATVGYLALVRGCIGPSCYAGAG